MSQPDDKRKNVRPIAPPVWFLALCTAGGVVGLTVLTPILPLVKSGLGVSSADVQQLLTVYLIAVALGHLICGPLSDRYGRRPILLSGAVLFAVAGAALVVTEKIDWLVFWRIVQGFGAAACMAMSRAMVNDAFERSEAARQMSTISMVLSIAPALSLAFAGFLAESAGWKSTMVLLFVWGLITLALGYFVAAETHVNKLRKINFRTVGLAYVAVLRDRLFICWTLASGMQVGIFFCLNALLAYQYQRNGYTLSEFGLWFSLTPVFYLFGNTFNRLWFVSRGIERAAMIGCTFSALSVVAMFVTQALGFTHALSLALPCCVFGFCNGIIIANSTVGAISASGEHAGTGTGIVGAWQMATGGIAGAIIVALGGARLFSVAAGGLMVMSAVSVLAMLVVYRQREAE